MSVGSATRRTFLRLLGLAPAAPAAAAVPVACAQPEEGHWLPVGVVPEGDPHEIFVWAYYPHDGDIDCDVLGLWLQGGNLGYIREVGVRFWSIPASAPAPPVTAIGAFTEMVREEGPFEILHEILHESPAPLPPGVKRI